MDSSSNTFLIKITAGPDGNGEYTGIVCDADGNTEPGQVSITGIKYAPAESSASVYQAVIDHAGNVSFSGLPPMVGKLKYMLLSLSADNGPPIWDWERGA